MSSSRMISVKSKQLQSDLGVKTSKSAKRKLLKFGLHIMDQEFVSRAEWDQLIEAKLSSTPPGSGDDWTKDTPFEGIE